MEKFYHSVFVSSENMQHMFKKNFTKYFAAVVR